MCSSVTTSTILAGIPPLHNKMSLTFEEAFLYIWSTFIIISTLRLPKIQRLPLLLSRSGSYFQNILDSLGPLHRKFNKTTFPINTRKCNKLNLTHLIANIKIIVKLSIYRSHPGTFLAKTFHFKWTITSILSYLEKQCQQNLTRSPDDLKFNSLMVQIECNHYR